MGFDPYILEMYEEELRRINEILDVFIEQGSVPYIEGTPLELKPVNVAWKKEGF